MERCPEVVLRVDSVSCLAFAQLHALIFSGFDLPTRVVFALACCTVFQHFWLCLFDLHETRPEVTAKQIGRCTALFKALTQMSNALGVSRRIGRCTP